MFFHILKNELKYQFKNITFYIMAILLVAFCMTQMELPSKNETLLSKEELFGNIASSEEESFHRIKNSAMQSLSIVIDSKEVGTYDFGFIRYYKFEDDQIKVLEEFKGQLEASTTIDEIEKIYGEIDEFIGKKTGIFSSEKIREARESALTDEEAEKKIAELKEKEKISGTYGRLYLSEFRLYNLVIRFNVVGSYDYYMRNINNLIINRVFFTVLGLAFLALAIFAYNKVRGNMNGRRILLQFKNIRK